MDNYMKSAIKMQKLFGECYVYQYTKTGEKFLSSTPYKNIPEGFLLHSIWKENDTKFIDIETI